jgi:hypothetical protein
MQDSEKSEDHLDKLASEHLQCNDNDRSSRPVAWWKFSERVSKIFFNLNKKMEREPNFRASFNQRIKLKFRPPLWFSGQSSWLQIQRSGFDSRRYQIFCEVVGLSLVSITEELLQRISSGSSLEIR